MLGLEDLGRYTEADVARLLDAAVNIDVAIVNNEDQETRHSVVAVASLSPGLGDFRMLVEYMELRLRMQLTKFTTVSEVAKPHPGLLAVLRVGSKDTAVALIDLNKLLHECLDLLCRRRSSMLNHADTPAPDRTILVVHGELATAAAG